MVWSMMGSSPPSSANLPKVLSFSAEIVLSRMRFWPPIRPSVHPHPRRIAQGALYGLFTTPVKPAVYLTAPTAGRCRVVPYTSCECIQQCPGLLEVGSVKPIAEPAVDR